MRVPTHAEAAAVLCLQAADNGRGDLLFGDSMSRVRTLLPPFMEVEAFPDVYLEFPLTGEPFLDVTVLYGQLERGTHIQSDLAVGTDRMLDWFAQESLCHERINCGFELDTKNSHVAQAAIHFQPREHLPLVEPFCEAVGEPERAQLYLDLGRRMPKGWPLSFFGLFRGRPGSPMRVCGYLDHEAQQRCAHDPRQLQAVFETIGFTAYDDHMLTQASRLMSLAPHTMDFQFDIYPDGGLSDVFALDAQFGIAQPSEVLQAFADGPSAALMEQLEAWGAADKRWHAGVEAAFARALPVELDDGSAGRYAFTLMPRWVKARWIHGQLQPSKLYHLGKAKLLK